MKIMNKESSSQQARGYSLSLQIGTNANNHSKLEGIKPIWSNKKADMELILKIVSLIILFAVLLYGVYYIVNKFLIAG